MIKTRVIAALLSLVVGAGAIAAGTAPAAADGAYFGFSFGGNPSVRFGYSEGYQRHYAPYPPAYGHYRPAPPRWVPPPRRVEICEPVWTTRRIHDRWGRLIKVVKVKRDECRLVYR